MIIYHGSVNIVETPSYGLGKVHNDYGRGFYCTEDVELAEEWACQTLRGGFCNIYNLDTDILNVCDLDNRSILEWLAILLDNRMIRYSSPIERSSAEYVISRFLPDISEYDVIKGYRADDSYFSFARAFLSNTISLHQLSDALKLGELGIQICLKSELAFKHIRFIEAKPVDGSIFFPKRKARDQAARDAYNKSLETESIDDLFVRDIIREEMGIDELRV